MKISPALRAELGELAERSGIIPGVLTAYVQQDGTCLDGIALWDPCPACNRKPLQAEVRTKLDAIRLYLGVPAAEVFPMPQRFTMGDIAELRETTTGRIRVFRNRYPAGHPNAFPQPEDLDAYSPWWNADRKDELLAWQPTGRGNGRKRRRANDAAPAPTDTQDAQTPADDPADPAGTDQTTADPLAPLTPIRPISKAATNHVFRNLQRQKDGDLWDSAGQTFGFRSREAYRERAMSWLREHSELKSATIESADWNEVFEYFRPDRKFMPEPEPAVEPTYANRRISDDPEHAGMTNLGQVVAYELNKAKAARTARAKTRKTPKTTAPKATTKDIADWLTFKRDPATGAYIGKDTTWKYAVYRQEVVDAFGKRRKYWRLTATWLTDPKRYEESEHETRDRSLAVARQYSALGPDYEPAQNEWRTRMSEAAARAYEWNTK